MAISPSLYDEVNNSFFKEVKEVYVDLRIIQDIYLGVLLKKCLENQDESCYNHIRDQIPIYNRRVHDDYSNTFPKLEMTNSDIDQALNNPDNTRWLLNCSPLTNMFIELREWAIATKLHNNRNKFYNPIIWNINVHPFRLDKELIQLIKKRIQLIDPTAVVGVISKPIDQLSRYTLKKFQFLFIYDLISFLSKNEKMSKLIYQELLFYNAIVYGPSRLEDLSLLESSEKEIIDSFKLVEALVGFAFTDFGYTDIHILTK